VEKAAERWLESKWIHQAIWPVCYEQDAWRSL